MDFFNLNSFILVFCGVLLVILAYVFVKLNHHLSVFKSSLYYIDKKISQNRSDLESSLSLQRQEVNQQLQLIQQQVSDRLSQDLTYLRDQIRSLSENNEKQLESISHIVDEKLQSTLEKRLGESFKMVSDRLEMVHKGLGDMQHLATGVGDLKKVLMNVKTRGTWGEVQLGQLLDQVLSVDQYMKNVKPRPGSDEVVEFAIKLPGKDTYNDHVWLPIDAKFPQDYYNKLCVAQDSGSKEDILSAEKNLERRIKQEAKQIQEKYLEPPHTTDFAIMFLPTEGLYAEVLRLNNLFDDVQQQNRVLLAGPTNLAALLNSLQMGFRTLTIEKRSSEIWELLTLVKTEFVKFGSLLDKTQKKLNEASQSIELASKQSKKMESKLYLGN